MRHNQLTSILKGIGQLKQLQALYLGNNQLSELPQEIGQLKHLMEGLNFGLDLSNNQFIKFTNSIMNLPSNCSINIADNFFLNGYLYVYTTPNKLLNDFPPFLMPQEEGSSQEN